MAMAEERTGAQSLQLHESARPTRIERHHSLAVIHYFNLCFATFGQAARNNKVEIEDERKKDEAPRTAGGWKTIPFLIGNEACEKLAVVGLNSNMVVYLVTKYNIKKVAATNMLNVWSGTTSLATLPGAFLADSYLGRFTAIAIGCLSSLLGMSILTLTALVPRLRPSSCSALDKKLNRCEGVSKKQFALLVLFFAFMAVGSAGIRPSTIAFGADQFNQEGAKGIKRRVQSFFNWYYFSTCVALIVALTVIVYIQSNVSWGFGFGICTAMMLISTVFFLLGRPIYLHEVPQGSAFTGFAQVIVASIRKRSLSLPSDSTQIHHGKETGSNPSLTEQFRFFNKAAIITQGDIRPDGSSPVSSWRVCSVKQIEGLKSIIRTLPIFSCGIANQITVAQQHTFSVLQALTMDRTLGSKGFKIPSGSFSVFSLLTLIAWLPFYDRVVVPITRRITRDNRGITMFQRMGIGFAISALSMLVAGLVEVKRRSTAVNHGLADQPSAIVPISAFWLVPQFCIAGLGEAFHTIGNLEFFYDQFPPTMRSTAIALSSCTSALGHYLSAIIVTIVHNTTGRHGRTDWLNDNLNRGHLEYFYWLLSAMEALNLIYFIFCARWYKYGDASVEEANLSASTSCEEIECTQV